MAENSRSTRDLVLYNQVDTPSLALNDQSVVNTHLEDNIVRILDNKNIPWFDRKKLIKDNLKAVITLQRTHIGSIKELDETETKLQQDIKKRALQGSYEKTVLLLQEAFIELFEKIGTKVAKDQFRFMRDFAELITSCKQEISASGHIEEYMKEAILQRLNAQFERTLEKLDYVVEDLLGKIEDSKKTL